MHSGSSAHYGNVFVGAFGCTTDKITFLGNPQEKHSKICGEVLGNKTTRFSVSGSDLVGLFMAANSKGAVFPEFVFKEEVKIAEENGLNTYLLQGRFTAIGNNLVVNDKIGLANPEMPKEQIKGIEECLGIEVIQTPIASYKTVGSACVLTNKGFLLHNNAGEELERMEELLGLKGGIGTANMGVPFVGICMLANSKGYVSGEQTGGFEFHRIDEALGFID